jgi:hypothetical protein
VTAVSAKSAVRDVAPWIEILARVGYIAKAVLYATIGFLAARAALGQDGGRATDTRGALHAVLDAPFGRQLLLVIAGGLAHAGRLGLVGALLVALIWMTDGGPTEKSNVRAISEEITPSLKAGDLVVSTQPEQIPVLSYYLPPGLRYATLWGPVDDLGVTDWRDGVRRLRGTNAPQDLEPLLDALPRGRRIVLVEPIINNLSRWQAPWTQLVRVRSTEWRQYLSNDPRLTAVAVRPAELQLGINVLRATVLL